MLVEMDIRALCDKYNITIKGIIQVGSYIAREYNRLREVCDGQILLIDANPDVIDILRQQLTCDNNIILNYLVSDKDGDTHTFNILNHTQSSSLLRPKLHIKYYPQFSTIVKELKIESITLDTIISKHNIDINKYNALLIDVQGAELLVLKGFRANIDKIDIIYAELNFEEMYDGCCLAADFIVYLRKFGFELIEMFDTGKGWGDGLFRRC